MKLLISILLFIFISASARAEDICEKQLAEPTYSSAIAELAHGYISIEKMKTSGVVGEGIIRKVEKSLEQRREELIEALGQKKFQSTYDKALKKQSGLIEKQQTVSRVSRRKRLKAEQSLQQWQMLHEVKASTSMGAIQVSSNGRYISYAEAGKIILVELSTGKKIKTSDLAFESAYFTADGENIVAGTVQSKLIVQNIASGEIIREFKTKLGSTKKERTYVRAVLSPNGEYVAAVNGSRVEVFSFSTGESIAMVKMSGDIMTVSFSPNSDSILTSYEKFVAASSGHAVFDTVVEVLDLATKNKILRVKDRSRLTQAIFDPNQPAVLLSFDEERGHKSYDLTGQAPSKFLFWKSNRNSSHFGADIASSRLRYTPDNRKFLVEGHDHVFVYNADDLEELHALDIPGYSMNDENGEFFVTSVSADSKTAAIFHYENPAQIWDLNSGEIIQTLDEEAEHTQAHFSSDGRYLITADKSGKIVIWYYQHAEEME